MSNEELEERVKKLEELTESLLRVLWMERGQYKDISNRAEKDLGQFWAEYLESKKVANLPK
jgi:hypothetical protein